MPIRPTPAPNFYDNLTLDRADERRRDEAWLAEKQADPASLYLPVWQSRSFLGHGAEEGEDPTPAFLDCAQVEQLEVPPEERIFLGLIGERAFFAVDISRLEEPDHQPALAGRGHFTDLRAVGPLMGRAEGALLAYARGIVYWTQRHRFCGSCGAPTKPGNAGHLRLCGKESCATPHFPRTDPAIIVLIHDGAGNCLLGRQAIWAPGMHSTLAGFLEPGESLEMTVAREVYEEVGLELTDITYQHSQPWPFPSSLMVGFHARALGKEIKVNEEEVESANWFSADFLRASPEDDSFKLPRKDSIARRLINDWLEEV